MADHIQAFRLYQVVQSAMTVCTEHAQKWGKSIGIICIGVLCSNQDVSAQEPQTRTIAAANSTCTTIKKAAEIFAQRHGISFSYICKSSGRLAKGIKGGMITPDYFISANEMWMKELTKNGHIKAEVVKELWGNELVLAHPRNHPLNITTWEDIATDKIAQLLIGDPGTAPFGRYSKQALQSVGLWNKVKSKISTRKHITLLSNDLANAGAATAGMLFSTNLTEDLQTVLHVPSVWHDPIRYYGAPTADNGHDKVMTSFVSYLKSPEAQDVFSKAGFKILP
ncbi:MAG: molybdate ABC transporter substrate-binding protein [Magnetovibrio sp.]|nr:molybdate ABC transporter substrate-binding protein [Magnetovibrio sp.]